MDAGECDTLDLSERRVETATLPVPADTAFELFVSFIGDSQEVMHGQVQTPHDPQRRQVTWVAEPQVTGYATFIPIGTTACLMECELVVPTGQSVDMTARTVEDFREFVAGVSLPR